MNKEEFWNIIEAVKEQKDPVVALREKLKTLEARAIMAFQNHLDRYFAQANDMKIWGAAYLIQGGCSDDAFMDFRYGVISRGKDFYEQVLADPDSLVDLIEEGEEIGNEAFGYVAAVVYEAKTGEEIEIDEDIDFETKGEEWDFDDEDECEKHLPKLTKKYY